MPLNNAQTFQNNLNLDLTDQAITAVLTHAQGVTPTAAQVGEILQFELGLSTAQIEDNFAGRLSAHGAGGGPLDLSRQPYYPGDNDALGNDPTGEKFNPTAFTLYTAWEKTSGYGYGEKEKAREEIAAGEKLFNTQPAIITGVRGLNDNATWAVRRRLPARARRAMTHRT